MTHFFYVTRDVFTLHNVLDRADEAQNPSQSTNDDGLYAEQPHYNAHGSKNSTDKISISKLDLCASYFPPSFDSRSTSLM